MNELPTVKFVRSITLNKALPVLNNNVSLKWTKIR